MSEEKDIVMNDSKNFLGGEITKNEQTFIPRSEAARADRAQRLHDLLDKHYGNANILVIVGTELNDEETGRRGHSVEIDGLLSAHPMEGPKFLANAIAGLSKKIDDMLSSTMAIPMSMDSIVHFLTKMSEVEEEEAKPEEAKPNVEDPDANQTV